MRVHGYSAFIFFLVAGTLSVTAQQVSGAAPEPFYYVALTDPACPVSGFTAPAPFTNEIHVLYFPMTGCNDQGTEVARPARSF